METIELLTYATLGMIVVLGFIGIYGVYMYLYPYSSAIYGFVKTPIGWQLKKLKLTKDNKLRLGKTEFSNWSWDKAVDLQLKRFGMTKWVKAFYIDPDAAVVLDPQNPNSFDTLEAKKSMVVSQLLTSLTVSKAKERLLMISIVVIVVVFALLVGFIVYNNNQSIIQITDKINTLIQFLNQTQSQSQPQLVRP